MVFGKPIPTPAGFEAIFTDDEYQMLIALCVMLASVVAFLSFVPAPGTGASKTFLPQKSLFPLWKDGFETWHITVFLVGLVFGNIYLVTMGIIDRPTPGKLKLDELLVPANPVFRLMLLTWAALFAKTHAMAWAQVWMGCKNNSFSKNPWDLNDGTKTKAAIKTEQDLVKSTFHNVHSNDLENIPLALTLHVLLVLVQPTLAAAKLIMLTFTVSRFMHTIWYMNYGSHEVRATLWSLSAFSNYAAIFQLLAACKVV
jgi:uncharacterized membrane protein YecN with MAPEG domain|eukprot:CAMPEP_0115836326 /NCGR_PEP_ID=MMETSP0287-20121206/4650_1 /TAXON_ID=412157 /ORGANISM="Chrysochromulina rotalis, Strain UIO044" /LENGTH=255 /DNA_ID=CAMNT_0003289807 /DNA_START=378 /DNA_END=1145 /DNA_ORIENTATION=-